VITGLDHTPAVCMITKKFEVAKYFTQINYAQGLFIWIFNKAWIDSLPEDLKTIFIQTVHDVCAENRKATAKWEEENIDAAKAEAGVEFFKLSDEEMAILKKQSMDVYEKYAPEINRIYPGDTYKPANFLKEVQDFLK
ncbi:MAG: TRAP transporter substrate-binding protein, partial [Desulfatirhabdiaceae bacterium]